MWRSKCPIVSGPDFSLRSIIYLPIALSKILDAIFIHYRIPNLCAQLKTSVSNAERVRIKGRCSKSRVTHMSCYIFDQLTSERCSVKPQSKQNTPPITGRNRNNARKPPSEPFSSKPATNKPAKHLQNTNKPPQPTQNPIFPPK